MIAKIITHVPTAFPDKKRYIRNEDCAWFEKEKEIFIIQQDKTTVSLKNKKKRIRIYANKLNEVVLKNYGKFYFQVLDHWQWRE